MRNKVSLYFFDRFKQNEAQIHELRYLFWECTQRCNLNCLHCGSDCVSDSSYKDMPFSDFLSAILPLKNVYKPDSINVIITGGEPLLRKDIGACGMALRENGFRWGIVTNGYAYNETIHKKLLASGMGSVTVSLDGLEENHNWLRGNNNSFSKAVRALELISSSNRLNYDVVTCVNNRNIYQLNELKEFLIRKNIKAWRLFTIAPIGRAQHNGDMVLGTEQLNFLMDFIAKSREEKNIDVKFSCEAYVGAYEKKVRPDYFFCRAGIHIASVLIDGSISACPNINRNYTQGNIYKDDFLKIWNQKFQIMRERSWTKKGICNSCKDYKHCNGGAMHLWDEKQENILYCIHHQITKA